MIIKIVRADLLISCHMAGSVLSALRQLALTLILWSRYYPLFRDEETEAHTGDVTCPRVVTLMS